MRSIVKNVFLVMRLLFKLLGVDCSCTQCKHYRLSEFDGKTVADFQLATFLHVEIAGLCSRRCSEDHRCRSYRYNTRTKTCSTYGGGFSIPTRTLNNVTEEDGSRLFAVCRKGSSFGMKCVTSANCTFGSSACIDGVCGCVTGTSYDVTTGDCQIRCSSYGNESSIYTNSSITSCNRKELTTSTMQACITACKAESGFVCISAEFYTGDGECHMCDIPAWELPRENLNAGTDPGWSLAVRHCGQ